MEKHAKEVEPRLDELLVSQKADRLRWRFQLRQDVQDNERLTSHWPPLVASIIQRFDVAGFNQLRSHIEMATIFQSKPQSR